jgi:serine/threonine-protein kinase
MGSVNDTTVAERAGAPRRELARGTSVGRYLLLDMLGEGGMGVVYKAYDPELGRPVALKLLRTGQGTPSRFRDRLLREAQALAQLQHPNVIAVHDVGTFDDQVFIAMEFVEGRTVRAWLKERRRTRREILDVFLAAGEGLASAHKAGLIHRDFKPENLMLGEDGRVRVLDFGLARAANTQTFEEGSVDGTPVSLPPPERSESTSDDLRPSQRMTHPLLESRLTHAGAIVGTPAFMAPEQRGEGEVGEAADQFSFCVSLYWSLYDAFPFDRLENAVDGEVAEPPAGATVPRWLRQVLVRGLRGRPADRYPSMGALLEALRADPVEALRRRVRGALGVIAVLALLSAAWAGGLAYRARSAAQLAQRFGLEAAQVSAIARYAALLPLHDTRRELDAIRVRMESLKQQMKALGPLADGPGHYALGRGNLTLEKYDEALQELDEAWSTGYHGPELAYALGLVHGQLYQRALADLRKTKDRALDARRREEIARSHRDPALHYLKLAAANERQGHPLAGVEATEYVEGLIALYEQRWDEALALARAAGDRVSWLFESRTLEGDVHYLRGKELFEKGDVDGAIAAYRRAGEAYRAVTEVAHSSSPALVGECREWLEIEALDVQRDRSPAESQKRALAACTAAAAARPDLAAPVALQARTWTQLSSYQRNHGINATTATETAVFLGEQALAIDPRDTRAHQALGNALLDLADLKIAKEEDPRALYAQAIAQAKHALDVDPGFAEAYGLLMSAYLMRSRYEASQGLDPRESLRSAATSGREEARRSPGDFGVWNGLGLVQTDRAEWERDHGGDPATAFEEAEQAFEKVAQLSPNLDYGYANLCWLDAEWALHEIRRGDNPERRIGQTLDWCQRAIRLDGDDAVSYYHMGRSYLYLASLRVEERLEPTELLERGRSALGRAFEIDRENWPTHGSMAAVIEARWLAGLGRDPQAAFAKAEAAGKSELARQGAKSVDALLELAEVYRRRAEWRAGHKQSVDSDVREGLALTARASKENPSNADVAHTEGALHLILARAASGAVRTEAAGQARATFEKALRMNANLEHGVRPMLDEATRLAE